MPAELGQDRAYATFFESHPVAAVVGFLTMIMTVGGIILDGKDLVALGFPGYVWAAAGAAIFMVSIMIAVYRQNQPIGVTTNEDAPIKVHTDLNKPSSLQQEETRQFIKSEIDSLISQNEHLQDQIQTHEKAATQTFSETISNQNLNAAKGLRQDRKENFERIDELKKQLRDL